jgi:hypothetical protein
MPTTTTSICQHAWGPPSHALGPATGRVSESRIETSQGRAGPSRGGVPHACTAGAVVRPEFPLLTISRARSDANSARRAASPALLAARSPQPHAGCRSKRGRWTVLVIMVDTLPRRSPRRLWLQATDEPDLRRPIADESYLFHRRAGARRSCTYSVGQLAAHQLAPIPRASPSSSSRRGDGHAPPASRRSPRCLRGRGLVDGRWRPRRAPTSVRGTGPRASNPHGGCSARLASVGFRRGECL